MAVGGGGSGQQSTQGRVPSLKAERCFIALLSVFKSISSRRYPPSNYYGESRRAFYYIIQEYSEDMAI